MDNTRTLHLKIAPSWSALKSSRERVTDLIDEHCVKIRTATEITVSELLENAIKYGHSEIDFRVTITSSSIIIKVTNQVTSKEDLDNVRSHIERLNKQSDPYNLYTKRLEELAESSGDSRTQLGLYRIEMEGGFSLSYQYTDDRLTVTAQRTIATKQS